MLRTARSLTLCCTLLSLAVTARAGDVVVVAPLGGDGVALLQAALDAASDGDILLLRDGNYLAPDSTAFVIDGKGVSVIADGTGPLFMRGFRVENTPPGSLVLLRDLNMSGWDLGTETLDLPLRATNVEGTLWLEDCVLEGEEGVYDLATSMVQAPRPAAFLHSCSSVVMERCDLEGGSGFESIPAPPAVENGAYGMEVRNTLLVMHGCEIYGGDGGQGSFRGAAGGDGLRVTQGSFAVLSDALCEGGVRGIFSPMGKGGDGVQVLADGSTLWNRNCTFVSGGSGGLPVNASPGSLTSFTSPTGTVVLPGVSRVGEPGTLIAQQLPPGTAVFLGLSFQGGFLASPGLEDALMLGINALVGPKLMGVADSGGNLSAPFTTPFLPMDIDGLTVLTQAFYLSPGGYPVLGPGSSIAVVQTSF